MLKEINPDVISIDWRMDIFQAQNFFGRETTIQGNLDPVIAATGEDLSQDRTDNREVLPLFCYAGRC